MIGSLVDIMVEMQYFSSTFNEKIYDYIQISEETEAKMAPRNDITYSRKVIWIEIYFQSILHLSVI